MVDALKLPNQVPRVSGESLQKCVAWRCPNGVQYLFCWSILTISGQLLASSCPVVGSRYLNLVFGHVEATPNKCFLSSPTKYTVEPSWPLVLVWPPLELLHRTLTTIVFAQYCRMRPISHLQSPIHLRNGSLSFRLAKALQLEIQSIMFFGVNWCSPQTWSFFLNPTFAQMV
ncbi:hypothetical protein TNCV_3130391 [Trichonephila clavipes]|nr:hypothetical protein TNCV_3130391 [Trichonephila clavipes]